MEPNHTGPTVLKDTGLRDLHILDDGVPPECEVDSFRWADGTSSTIQVGRSLSKRRQPKVVAQFPWLYFRPWYFLCRANSRKLFVRGIVPSS
jgi:hypothetical protein